MEKLIIDPQFRDLLPPQPDEVFRGMRDNILECKKVRDPLVVWEEENILLDGHHRWKVIKENWNILKDAFTVEYLSFPSRPAAIAWTCRNQIEKRNLSPTELSYTRGLQYEAEKQLQGGTGANQYTARKEQIGQNVQTATTREIKDGTAGRIGKQTGVTARTVRRDAEFAKGVEAVREEFPGAAQNILKGNSGITKEFISSIPSMPEEKKMAAIEAVKDGPEAVAKFKKNATMEECNATPIVHEEAYNERDFAGQVSGFSKEFDDMIRLFLMVHGDMLSIPACASAFEKMLTDTENVIKHYKEVLNEHRN